MSTHFMEQNCVFTSPVRLLSAAYEMHDPSPDSSSSLMSTFSPAFYRTPTTKKRHLLFSPGINALPYSPESPAHLLCLPASLDDGGSERDEQIKRGRPPANAIQSLINQGSVAESSIRCRFCSRVFPREKSLQAHMRTHTGERPYICDFPDCNKAFCQSGQLKTHLRLHTGEKPFVCSAPNCGTRFTHANRHCPDHPAQPLIRDDANMPPPQIDAVATSPEAATWLQRYMIHRQEKTTPFKPQLTTHLTGTKRSLYRDLEKQFQAASRRLSDTDVGGSSSQENKDPFATTTPIKQRSLSASATADSAEIDGIKPGQVSVIRRAPSSAQNAKKSLPQKRSGCLVEICNSQLSDGSHASPSKRPPEQESQDPRYASALALIQLAQGHC